MAPSLVLIALTLTPLALPAAAWDWKTVRIATGVKLMTISDVRGPVRAFALQVVVGSALRVEPALADRAFPMYASTPRIASREGAIATVNGDFGEGRPLHPLALGRELITTGDRPGQVVAFTPGGTQAFVSRPHMRVVADPEEGEKARIATWNAGPPVGDQLAAYTRAGGVYESPPPYACSARLLPSGEPEETDHPMWTSASYMVDARRCGRDPMGIERGVVLSSRRSGAGAQWIRSLAVGELLVIRWSAGWPAFGGLQGGQPLLVHNGSVAVPARCADLFCLRQPRTGIGIRSGCEDGDPQTSCEVLLVVVDGRRAGWSSGLTLVGFARLMRRLGAVEALNLDGATRANWWWEAAW